MLSCINWDFVFQKFQIWLVTEQRLAFLVNNETMAKIAILTSTKFSNDGMNYILLCQMFHDGFVFKQIRWKMYTNAPLNLYAPSLTEEKSKVKV